MRVADYIADFLAQEGVREIFMLSGTGSIYLDDAFANQEKIRYICARHESAAVIMAEAVSKLTGKIGVVVSTTGPGATNAAAGVVEAWVDSVPVLIISGQVSSKNINRLDRSFGIQGFDIIKHVKDITKYAVTITDPTTIRYHLEKAIYFAKNKRPGPVWLDIPMDIQEAIIESPDKLLGFTPEVQPRTELQKDELIDDLICMLSSAKYPTVIFGQGIRNSNSIKKFKQFLEKLKIPAISARMGKDILPYDYHYYMGMGGIKGQIVPSKVLARSDLIISLGTSHSQSFSVNRNIKTAIVNIDKKIFQNHDLNTNLSINMDLKRFINISLQKLKNKNIEFEKWTQICQEIKKDNPLITKEHLQNPINSYYLLNRLDELSDSHHIFVNDAGSANYVSSQTLQLNKGQREITSGAFYSMGLTIPLSVGAAACMDKSQIIAVTGDGSIELNLQELQTIYLNNLNIKLFVINNGGYASIRDSQDTMCGGRYTDDSVILDFSKIASAFNIPFYFLDDYKSLDKNIKDIFSKDGPALIEVLCDPNQSILTIAPENV